MASFAPDSEPMTTIFFLSLRNQHWVQAQSLALCVELQTEDGLSATHCSRQVSWVESCWSIDACLHLSIYIYNVYISWYLLLDCNILLWLLMLTREWAEWLYTLLWNVHIYQLATEKWSTLFLFILHRRDVAFLDQFPALWNKALLSIWWSRSILLELARGEPPALQQKGSYASSIRV